ncbi:MAG: hypothetical protein HOP29_09590 [Phycisphaerales bacterium]|nr:hypothetical protein [Phycisphaerales bacterium]
MRLKLLGLFHVVRALALVFAIGHQVCFGCAAGRSGDIGPTKPGADSFVDGVVVDSPGNAVYLMNPRGGIDAIELRSGKTRWHTRLAEVPLLLKGELLLAQSHETWFGDNVLRLEVLDVANPEETADAIRVILPVDVVSLVDQRPDMEFRVQARGHRGDVLVTWSFARRDVRGVAPDANERHSNTARMGTVRLDLAGRPAEVVSPVGPANIPEEPLPEAISRKVASGEIPSAPWRVGTLLVAIDRSAGDPGRVVLKRWSADSGESLESVTLFEGGMTLRNRSADGRHILASRPAAAGSGDGGSFIWSVFALETGARVGECRGSAPGGLNLVADSTLLQLVSQGTTLVNGKWIDEPLRLRATDLATGVRLWERPVRDTAYRGPSVPDRPAR